MQETLAREEEQLGKDRNLLAARQQDVTDLTKRIEETKTAAEKALGVQSDLEKQLFAADAKAAELKDKNEHLDQEIRTKELGR